VTNAGPNAVASLPLRLTPCIPSLLGDTSPLPLTWSIVSVYLWSSGFFQAPPIFASTSHPRKTANSGSYPPSPALRRGAGRVLVSLSRRCSLGERVYSSPILKGELRELSAGWRHEYAHNNILRFEPAAASGSNLQRESLGERQGDLDEGSPCAGLD
jgi:hypothetical protein